RRPHGWWTTMLSRPGVRRHSPARIGARRGLSGRTKALAVALAALIAMAGVAVFVPPIRARAKAAAVLARSVGVPFPRPFAAHVVVRNVTVAPGTPADLYWPGPHVPGIVLLPGGGPRGQ